MVIHFVNQVFVEIISVHVIPCSVFPFDFPHLIFAIV